MPKVTRFSLFVGFVVLTGALHSLYLSHASFFLDEAVHIWYALRSVADVLEHGANDPNPPIFNLMEWGWLRVFGISEFAMRSMSVLMLALSAGFLYLFSERNFNRSVGIIAALIFILSPIQYRFSHLARPYSLLMLTTVFSYGFLFEMLKQKHKLNMLGYYVFTTLMLFVHPTSIFNLPAQGLIVLVSLRKERIKDVFLVVITGLSALSFGAYYLSIPYFEEERPMWFGAPNMENVLEVLHSFYGSSLLFRLNISLLALVITKSFLARKFNTKLLWPLLWGAVTILSSVCFSIWIKPIFQDKYIMTAQIGLVLLFAFMLDDLLGRRLKILTVMGVLGALVFQIDWKPKPEADWKNAVAYVTRSFNENESIVVDPWYEHPSFAYYFNRDAFTSKTSAGAELAKDRVYTGYQEFLDESGNPKTPIMHLLLAHEGFVPFPEGLDTLLEKARLIDTKQFIAVRTFTYDFNQSIQVIDSTSLKMGLNITDGKERDCTGELSSSRVYSCAVQLEVPKQSAGYVQIRSSVKIKAEGNLNNVLFMVTASRNDSMLLYRPIPVKKPDGTTDWFEITDTHIFNDLKDRCTIGVYLWSQKGEELELKDLKVAVLN